MHNLLIGKNILVRGYISNPALYHQFQNPDITIQTITVDHDAHSITSVTRITVLSMTFHFFAYLYCVQKNWTPLTLSNEFNKYGPMYKHFGISSHWRFNVPTIHESPMFIHVACRF